MSEATRKLAAIVFTDIVGFTKLSAKDEKKAFQLLDTQRDLLKPIVKTFNGDWLKEMGDGLLLTFPTVSAAVECSIQIQSAVKDIENLDLRIGIHEGEITEKDGDVFGDDVNVASRIEPFSAAGGISISGKVQQNISSLPEYRTEYLGQPSFKGVAQKVEVYCIVSHSLPKPKLDKINAKLDSGSNKSLFKRIIFPITGFVFTLIGGIVWFILPLLSFGSANEGENYEKRIAVLYFENRGETKDLYFADGLTEEIISRLSRVKDLSVVSKFDIAEFKGKNINIENIKDKTKADFILSGNVLRINDKIKITAELTDIIKREVPWGDTFERNVTDIFSVQDEVALNIVNNLDMNISSRDRESVTIDPTSNVKVFDRLAKAKASAYNLRTTDDGIDNMINTLNEIVSDDSTYADALSTRGFYLFLKYWYQGYWTKAEKLEKLSSPREIVFGHNDLLAANFLDDGSKIWVVDWEYGGFNDPLFDIGGLSSNNDLDENLENEVLEMYFKEKPSKDLIIKYNAMKTASLLRETMWSMVSEITSKIEFKHVCNLPGSILVNLLVKQ